MRAKAILAYAASLGALLLTGCDPGVHISWEKDFEGPLDYDCIERALRTVAPDVRRTTWVDDGADSNGFPRGTEVTQFNYSDPSRLGGYSLNVALLENGKTHYDHQWGKIGTGVPPEEERQVLPLLNRANDAVARMCGLSFADVRPKERDG